MEDGERVNMGEEETREEGQERFTMEDVERVSREEFSETDSMEDEGEELEKTKIEIISGNKKGSKWLVIDNAYLLHKNDESSDDYTGDTTTYWECSRRRKDKCMFKAATQEN